MGGGAGASMHGRFRVATENSVTIFCSLFQVSRTRGISLAN
jgi:hypothetical protein